MRIQPREIDVPEDDPFKYDLLGRKETVEVLTHVVNSIEGPCVLSVDAAWGTGKTTFLKIWAQYLRNEGFPVVEFNAWETDFSEEPFVALSTELTEGITEYKDESLENKIDDMKAKAKEVVRSLVPELIQVAAAGVPLVGTVLGESLASLAEKKLTAYGEARESVKKFKNVLQETANTLSESRGGHPLVVIIDELDRCRPSYAVELLEVAKHLFAVDHIVFVLTVNRSELAHSIRALYGSDFDAKGYLRRFFDLDFRLPEPDRAAYIDAKLMETEINNLNHAEDANDARSMLHAFLVTSDLSLRQIAQAIHRLGLVFASVPKNRSLFARTTVVMFLLRTIDLDLYYRFIDGEVSDLDVFESVMESPRFKAMEWNRVFEQFWAIIIMFPLIELNRVFQTDLEQSPMYKHFQQQATENEEAKLFINNIWDFYKYAYRISQDEYIESIQRIELLSATFIDS